MRHTSQKNHTSILLALLIIFVNAPLPQSLVLQTRAQVSRISQQPSATPTPQPTLRRDVMRTRQRRPQPTPTPQPSDGEVFTPDRRNPRDTDDATSPTPTPTPRPTHGGGGIGPGGLVAIIGLAVVGGIVAHELTDGPSARDISKDGPKFPSKFSMSDFSVKAFVTGGWPLFVDYELEQPGHVIVTVKADGVDPFIYHCVGTSVGHHEEIITLPAEFGASPKVATYSIKAVRDLNNQSEIIPVYIYAFGAGHNAVGSAGIDQISFQPDSVRITQNEQARFSFHSRFDFNKVSADFMRIARGANREIVAQRVGRKQFKGGVRRDDWINDAWNCKEGRRASLGYHQLHVRAWRGAETGGDWMVTPSPQVVRVE